MAITKHDIWRVADELDAEGIRPTLAAVRKKLGSGSFTTISEAMTEWKGRQKVEKPTSDPVPVAVSEQLGELGNALWAIALNHASTRFDEDRKQFETDKEAVSQQLAETVELADTFTQENDQLRERVTSLETIEREQATRLEVIEHERNKLFEQLKETERRNTEEANRYLEKVAHLENEAKAVRGELKEASEQAAMLRGQLEALQVGFDEDRKRFETDKEAMSQQLAKTVELAENFARENEQLRKRVTSLEAVERERDKLTDKLAEVKRRSAEELNRSMEKVTQLDSEAIEARKEAKEANERAAMLQGQLETLKEQVANLTNALKMGGKQGGKQ